MTISSSFNSGVAGLTVNASRLATIADNIANAGSYGYKRAVTDFHSMMIMQSAPLKPPRQRGQCVLIPGSQRRPLRREGGTQVIQPLR